VQAMNLISNLWEHPRTTVVGVLLGVVTVAGALSQQGVSLGNAGRGTVVALVSGIATALLGILARDPVSGTNTASSSKLGAWALIALLLPLPLMDGCNGTTVAQNIVNWTPTLQSAVAAVDSAGAVLDPVAAPIFTVATVGFNAAANLLVSQAKAYLANPSASLLAQMQSQVVNFQQIVNQALLSAARIVDPKSQQYAISVIQVVATAVNAILALVAQLSGKVALAAMSIGAHVKLSSIEKYRDRELEAKIVAAHYGESVSEARHQISTVEQMEVQAGF
jgi:hypothetical protein